MEYKQRNCFKALLQNEGMYEAFDIKAILLILMQIKVIFTVKGLELGNVRYIFLTKSRW